jgi:hypothetical protein
MPDGDIYHNELPRRYQQIYRQVGEGHHPLETIAHQALTPLRQDLRKYGDPPIQFLLNVADQIAQFTEAPLLATDATRDAFKQSLEQQLRQVYGDRRAKQLAWHVIEHHLNQPPSDCSASLPAHMLLKQYILRVYASNCEARVTVPPTSSTTPLQLSHKEIIQQFAQVDPHIETSIDPFVDHLIRKETVKGLRLPRGPMETPVDLDEDLTASRRL